MIRDHDVDIRPDHLCHKEPGRNTTGLFFALHRKAEFWMPWGVLLWHRPSTNESRLSRQSGPMRALHSESVTVSRVSVSVLGVNITSLLEWKIAQQRGGAGAQISPACWHCIQSPTSNLTQTWHQFFTRLSNPFTGTQCKLDVTQINTTSQHCYNNVTEYVVGNRN